MDIFQMKLPAVIGETGCIVKMIIVSSMAVLAETAKVIGGEQHKGDEGKYQYHTRKR
jgi:hypothetical protein